MLTFWTGVWLLALGCTPADRDFALSPGSGGDGAAEPSAAEPSTTESGADAGQDAHSVSTCSDSAGSCAETCPGCFIDSECVAEGDENPDNLCQVCDPEADAAGWSSNEGATCDDDLYCTVGDACNDGECTGMARPCDDGVACNGDEGCDEEAEECTAGEFQCEGSFCDLELDECVTSCAGCVIDNQCAKEGTESRSNPCLVCDPEISMRGYSAALGKACGNEPEPCSEQDSCDDGGVCQPNHSDAGSACGSSSSSACDEADSCDGEGQCRPNATANGTDCDDGAYCSTASACQGGECVAVTSRSCSGDQLCNEETQSCGCDGCQIGADCIDEGEQNPMNDCEICNLTASRVAYSPNSTGALCGNGPSECSEQDTCNASGTCEANHLPDTTECTGGVCGAGRCEGSGPFECSTTDSLHAPYPEVDTVSTWPPPNMQGGVVPDGRYIATQIDLYGETPTFHLRALDFRGNSVQVAFRRYSSDGTATIPEIHFAGSYSVVQTNRMTFDLDRCDPEHNIDVPEFWFMPRTGGLTTVELLPGEIPMTTYYSRE